MKHIVNNTFLICTLLTALGVCATPASARGVAPFSGSKPQNFADSACFTEFGAGGIVNNCSGERLIHIATPVDTHGNVWGYATVYGATSDNAVSCQMFGIDPNSLYSYWASPRVYPSQYGSLQGITMGGAYVPDLGAAYMACWLNQGGVLRSVSWGQ